jgi:hypothetical protein
LSQSYLSLTLRILGPYGGSNRKPAKIPQQGAPQSVHLSTYYYRLKRDQVSDTCDKKGEFHSEGLMEREHSKDIGDDGRITLK